MKFSKVFTVMGAGAAMILSRTVDAAYQGLTVHQHASGVLVNGIAREVFRVYAMFTDEGDYLTAVGGSPTLGNLVVRTWNSSLTGPGGNFVNPVGGGPTAPTFNLIGTEVEWDTFVTIGLASVPEGATDETSMLPGFSGIMGSIINANNYAWFTAGPQPQGMAGNGLNIGNGVWGVLMMQLTVNAGNNVGGTVAIQGVNNTFAGGTQFLTNADQTFITGIPTPGALALLGAAGLKPRRRRDGSSKGLA